MISPRALLQQAYSAAVAAADPLICLPPHLQDISCVGRIVVVGAGKAASSMALAVERSWPERLASGAVSGLVITRRGQALPTERIRIVEAAHPVPDHAGAAAAAEILALAQSLGPDDLLLALISGGGSSLMTLPAEGLTLQDLQATNRELLRCGAPVEAMNVVRKHLSAISGGRLALATKARVLALIVSDVTGDDPSAIASGPCAPDASSFADALAMIARYGVMAPSAVIQYLERGAAGEIADTPKPGHPIFSPLDDRVENRIIAAPHQMLQAAASFFHTQGIYAAVLGDTVTGEAREVAQVYAALAREVSLHNQPFTRPVVLLSGGETTVTIRPENYGKGRGGRNTEFLLALALALDGLPGVHALACDTDGIDGSEDNAGAMLAPDTLARAASSQISARAALDANDAWGFFASLGDLIVTGPTHTNVNDCRMILVE